MSDETKQLTVAALAVVALAVTLAAGAVKCEVVQQTAIIDCTKAGRPPLECRAAVYGGRP